MKVEAKEFLKCEEIGKLYSLCANITYTQALWRALGPDEKREALLSRCINGCKKQSLTPAKAMQKLAEQLVQSHQPSSASEPLPAASVGDDDEDVEDTEPLQPLQPVKRQRMSKGRGKGKQMGLPPPATAEAAEEEASPEKRRRK